MGGDSSQFENCLNCLSHRVDLPKGDILMRHKTEKEALGLRIERTELKTVWLREPYRRRHDCHPL